MSQKPSRLRRSKRVSRDVAKKGPARSPARRTRRVAIEGPTADAVRAREHTALAREAPMQRRARALAMREEALQAQGISMAPITNIERLMSQLRDANERLIVTGVQAQSLSDDARAEATQARAELEGLMDQLQEANARLVAASAEARAMEKQAQQREEDYRRLSGRLLSLQDEERRRLALDLHDSTAQRLAALTMNLDLLEGADHGLDARLRRTLADSRSLAEQCAREVRTLAYLLHPPLLDESGLLPAVRWYVKGFTERSSIQVDLELGRVERLPRPMEVALFRVVQESLTNVHRHAASSTASIRLTSTLHAVTLEVHDRGRGLRDDLKVRNAAMPPETLGVGIQGMRERIRQLGGTFEVSFTDAGTMVRVRVPLHEGAA
jgi:signal transduction histidine kinase